MLEIIFLLSVFAAFLSLQSPLEPCRLSPSLGSSQVLAARPPSRTNFSLNPFLGAVRMQSQTCCLSLAGPDALAEEGKQLLKVLACPAVSSHLSLGPGGSG